MIMQCKCFKVLKFIKVTSNWHNAKSAERQKTSFPKESIKNEDLHEPLLKKIMTTHE